MDEYFYMHILNISVSAITQLQFFPTASQRAGDHLAMYAIWSFIQVKIIDKKLIPCTLFGMQIFLYLNPVCQTFRISPYDASFFQ
jgi:hypothetical protein